MLLDPRKIAGEVLWRSPTGACKNPIYCLSSPHAWGWSDVVQLPPCGNLVLPTRVGMVRMLLTRTLILVSSPRVGMVLLFAGHHSS
jgi:hypothetical protein